MGENLGQALVIAVFVGLIILKMRRRASMTPEQRRIEDLEHKQRKLERELRDRKRYGD